MHLTCEVFTDMRDAETQWREFEKRADCMVFQSFDWLSEWHRHIGSKTNMTPIIVVLSSDRDEIILILPLAVERRRMINRLTWLGSELSDYNAPILSPEFRDLVKPGQFVHIWRGIVQAIRAVKHFDVIEMEKMPDHVVSQSNPFSELLVLVANFSGHVAKLVGSWDQFYDAKISKSHRQTDRRKFRNLAKEGNIQFVTVQESGARFSTVNLLIKQKRESYIRMGVPDVFSRPGYLDFYRSIVTNPKLNSVVHTTRLDVGGIPAATGIGLIFKDCYSLVMSSYDDEYARHSPGRAHIHEMLRYAIDQKMKYFDFTIGDEAYKYDWSDIELRLLSYYENITMMGRVIVIMRNTIHRADTWYNQMPQLKQVVIRARRWIKMRMLSTRRVS